MLDTIAKLFSIECMNAYCTCFHNDINGAICFAAASHTTSMGVMFGHTFVMYVIQEGIRVCIMNVVCIFEAILYYMDTGLAS